MSSKQKFMEITKPMKFRNSRKFLSRCKALRERIIYLFNYILYKIHILDRYSYRDNGERHLGVLPYHKIITHKNLVASLEVRVIEHKNVNQDWFYFKNRLNRKYVVCDCEEVETHLVGVLTNLGIKVDGATDFTYVDYLNLPTYRVLSTESLRPTSLEYKGEERLIKPEYTEYTIDLNKIRNLKNVKCQHCKAEYISGTEMKYFYDLILEEYQAYFKDFNFNSIMVVRKQ